MPVHIGAILGLVIKEPAQIFVGHGFPAAQQPINLKNLLGLGKSVSYRAIVPDIYKEVRLERINGLVSRGIALLLEAIDNARGDLFEFGAYRDHRVKTKGSIFQRGTIRLNLFRELNSEIVQGEFREGDGFIEILKVEDFIFQSD